MDASALDHQLTDDERREYDERGYLVIPGALAQDHVEGAPSAFLDDVVEQRRRAKGPVERTVRQVRRYLPARWRPAPDGLERDGGAWFINNPFGLAPFAALVDHPTTLPKVYGLLSWNIHVYAPSVIVTPPATSSDGEGEDDAAAGPVRRTSYGWHRDAGRVEIEAGDPPPRLIVKVGFFLSDVSEPGRGNLSVIPGSHRWPADRPIKDPAALAEQVPICGPPGTAVIFDRRLAHTASRNESPITRKAVMYGYAYRWIAPFTQVTLPRRSPELDPVRLQLLGVGRPTGRFFPSKDDVPLRVWLEGHDAL